MSEDYTIITYFTNTRNGQSHVCTWISENSTTWLTFNSIRNSSDLLILLQASRICIFAKSRSENSQRVRICILISSLTVHFHIGLNSCCALVVRVIVDFTTSIHSSLRNSLCRLHSSINFQNQSVTVAKININSLLY